MNLSDFDAEFAAPPGAKPARLRPETFGARFRCLPAPLVPCGFFAITLTDDSVRHFRVRLDKGGIFAGQRTLARLTGPTLDTNEWETVATVAADGFAVFKRWRSDWVAKHALALWERLHGAENGYGVEIDVRCTWCLRELNDADSRARRYGATCGKKLGLIETKRRRVKT